MARKRFSGVRGMPVLFSICSAWAVSCLISPQVGPDDRVVEGSTSVFLFLLPVPRVEVPPSAAWGWGCFSAGATWYGGTAFEGTWRGPTGDKTDVSPLPRSVILLGLTTVSPTMCNDKGSIALVHLYWVWNVLHCCGVVGIILKIYSEYCFR